MHNKLSLIGIICDELEHKQAFPRSWLPLSGELAPQATEGQCQRSFLSLSLANARQLPRQREPRKRKSIGCLAEETKRPKINSSCAPGSPCQGSWRRRRLRGSLSLPQPRYRSAAPSSEGAKKEKIFQLLSTGSRKTKILSFLQKKINRYKITDILYFYIEYTSKKQYNFTINLHAKDVKKLSDPSWRKSKIS